MSQTVNIRKRFFDKFLYLIKIKNILKCIVANKLSNRERFAIVIETFGSQIN